MTEREMHLDHEGRGGDVAAYLLGALTEDEAADVVAHLAGCEHCRAELERLRIAVDALPMAVPQYRAPPAVKRRVMASVRAEARATAEDQAPRRLRVRWPQSSFSRPVFGLAAAAVVAAIVIGVVDLVGSSTSPRNITAQVIGVPRAVAVLRDDNGHGQLRLARMAAPPRGRVYEVWVQRPGRNPQPTDALFNVTSAGDATVAVPGSLHGVQRVLVTNEPAGGSRVPTTPPVIVASLV